MQHIFNFHYFTLPKLTLSPLMTYIKNHERNLRDAAGYKHWYYFFFQITSGFLKYVLKLKHLPNFADLVQKAFDAFILEHNYNADQTRFLWTVQTVAVQKRMLEVNDLYEPPFTIFGLNVVEKLSSEKDVEEILESTTRIIK